MRLALEDENLPLKQKCQYLYEACDASFAMKGHIQVEQYVRVTEPVLHEMLRHSIRYAASLKSEDSIRNEAVICTFIKMRLKSGSRYACRSSTNSPPL